MAMRRRRTFVRAPFKKKNYLWVREAVNNVSPVHQPTPNLTDLIAPFKTQFGVNLNLPDFTIWRVRIKISIHITPIVTVNSNDAVHFSMFTDDLEVSPTINSLSKPFAKKYMMWSSLYASEVVTQASGSVSTLYKEMDIRTHRRLENIETTLWASLVETGNANMLDYSYTYSILLRER